MKTILLLLILATIPHEIAVRDGVDLIERNEFFNDEGKPVFTQFIFWQWRGDRHEVVSWRLDHGMSFQHNPPQVTWNDGRKVRQVKAAYWRESFTQFDPEIREREVLRAELRRGLWGERP